MSVLGNAVKGNVTLQGSGKVLTKEQLKDIQRILLMMLEDIDLLCRKYNIHYVLIGGTAIGCVRHKGFIPWDDDVDIAMPRKDYERFRRIIRHIYPEKYNLTDAIRENNYGKNIPKLRLNRTEYKTMLKIDPEDKEITVDIFVIENVDDNVLLKYAHGVLCLLIGFLLSCRRLADNTPFFKDIYKGTGFTFRVIIGKLISFASLDKWAHWCENIYSMCQNDKSKYVTVPTDRCHFFGEIFPRYILLESIDADFNGRKFKIPKSYDHYLSHRYNNYMEIPPKEQQVLSIYFNLDFGPYRNLFSE